MNKNGIYCTECLEGMKKIKNETIDLTVTSPPYDQLRKYNGYDWDFESIAKELFRITKKGGVVVWIVADSTINGSETGSSFKQALYFKEIGFNLHDTMIWQKTNPIPQIKRLRYTNSFEYMFILSKGKPKTCNYLLVECKDKGKKVGKNGFKSTGEGERKTKNIYVNNKKIRNNVWNYAVSRFKLHPATFPEQLAKDHILSWSNENELVLDIFCGSGTTLKMAKILNRNFIGFDISSEYCEISKQRLSCV